MPKLIGTRHHDELFARDARDWVIRGRGGNDWLEGGAGDDTLWGGTGDDTIDAGYFGDADRLYGGPGNDRLDGGVERRGGIGDDFLSGNGLSVGGSGNDRVVGLGDLYGGEGPWLPQAEVGNDRLETSAEPGTASHTTMTGGFGSDQFLVVAWIGDGIRQTAEVMDYQFGVDKIGAIEWHGGGPIDEFTTLLSTFQHLDSTKDGILAFDDSIGPDDDWTTNDGSAVYTDGHSMYIGLGATFAGTSSNDAEDWLVVHGATQITLADWLMA